MKRRDGYNPPFISPEHHIAKTVLPWMRAKATAALIVTLVLRAAVSLPLTATAPGPSQAQGVTRSILTRRSTSRADSPASSMPENREGPSSTPEVSQAGQSQELLPRGAPSSIDTDATASPIANSPVTTVHALSADTPGAAGDLVAGGSMPQAAGSVPGSGSAADEGLPSGAPQAQISANDTASLSSGSLVFDGAGRLISGATGFGDSPPEYTGKQEWPELVGENAALAKAQLVTETHLQVILVPAGSAVTSDYRTNRIRIFYDPATFVVVQPSPAIG
ncbi:g12198 [Coccomyxa viridis]|uniref:G12198 protein n=1 Tax=Coccomyxa viridis TaxID=1274662 RepID=A0ABP1G9R9_9CHLO